MMRRGELRSTQRAFMRDSKIRASQDMQTRRSHQQQHSTACLCLSCSWKPSSSSLRLSCCCGRSSFNPPPLFETLRVSTSSAAFLRRRLSYARTPTDSRLDFLIYCTHTAASRCGSRGITHHPPRPATRGRRRGIESRITG